MRAVCSLRRQFMCILLPILHVVENSPPMQQPLDFATPGFDLMDALEPFLRSHLERASQEVYAIEC